MPAFMDRYPDIEIDIVASNRMVDVTDAGFDAGIRYGGTVGGHGCPAFICRYSLGYRGLP